MNRQQRRMAVKQAARSGNSQAIRISAFELATHHFQAGRTLQAESACRAILVSGSRDFRAFHRLGLVAHHFKRNAIAAELIDRAIVLKPSDVEAYASLSSVLKAMGRLDEAAQICQKAIEIDPGAAECYNALGRVLQEQQLFADAINAYQHALNLDPGHAAAYFNLGLIYSAQGEMMAASTAFREAARIKPDFIDAHRRLAGVLSLQGRLDEAKDCLQDALKIDPSQSVYFAELALILTKEGRLPEAVETYKKALTLKADDTAALNNLGNVLDELGNLDEAAAAYRLSLQVDPNNLTALSNSGMVHRKKNQIREAIDAYRKVLAINPSSHTALGELYQLRLAACDWSGIEQDEAAVLDLCRRRLTNEVPPFIVLAAPSATPMDKLDIALSWAENYDAPESGKFSHPMPVLRGAQTRKIRVGYLSADFYSHATAFLTAELFERHDRSRFDIIAYSHSKDDHSAMRQRLIYAFDEFVDIRLMAHPDAARRIFDDGVDILVDLKGHTQDARTQILARRPAPIQVNYLGYPGTMGADFIDYIIGDPIVTPMDQQRYFVEKIVQLPHCYQPNDTKRVISTDVPTRAECGLPEDAFVFCCFNNNYKLTPAVFDVWMRLLRAVPRSVLWLIESNDIVRNNLCKEAVSRGVDSSRLVFASKMPVSRHLARHCHADLFLDTLPYNAHTTTSDALWAGLPVITCLGDAFAGRVAGSLLRAVGLSELVTPNLQDYEELALKLATQPEMLRAIKGKLSRNRISTPLFDIERYTRNLERAYEHMVEIWQSAQMPKAFSVADLACPNPSV
ncbi:putative O-linked N-acetylglucosamine transferase (SPINDLY family) [Microvirga subterranea]|uniref:protein O-GlcNAc transferase n=2 Tax=Microvirga subterranea TaxID=186651 RepID=A0A370HD39_9HYPH|nr:putative O-linked N-acetylglucosamine transferase (SPINDLY family) [Microvirga subterranea]